MSPISQALSQFVSASPVEAQKLAFLGGSVSDYDAGSAGEVGWA